MKAFLCCVLLLSLGIPQLLADSPLDEAAIEKACIAETKANAKEVHDFWEDTVNYDKTAPSTKCILKCYMEKTGVFKGGVSNPELGYKQWNESAAKDGSPILPMKAFTTCKDEKGPNDCETAFKIVKCLRTFKA